MLESNEIIINEETSKQSRFECSQKLFQEVHYIGISVLFIMSIIDIISITELHIRIMFFQALALVPPIFAYKLATFLNNSLFKCITFKVASYLTLASGLIVWSMYALSGPSDPDAAGHMHILFFPIIHGLSIGIWIIIGMLVATIYKVSVHYKH